MRITWVDPWFNPTIKGKYHESTLSIVLMYQ